MSDVQLKKLKNTWPASQLGHWVTGSRPDCVKSGPDEWPVLEPTNQPNWVQQLWLKAYKLID